MISLHTHITDIGDQPRVKNTSVVPSGTQASGREINISRISKIRKCLSRTNFSKQGECRQQMRRVIEITGNNEE
jgi:hypothetical protein